MSKKNESLNTRLTRMQESRLDRERRMRRFIILGSILVGVVTVVLVAAALLQMFVLEPQRAVATVGGQPISLQQLQKRMRYEQSQVVNQYNRLSQNIAQLQSSTDPSNQFLLQIAQQQLQSIGQQGSAEAIAQTSLSNMIDEQLVKREANSRGITVTPEEVTAELERNFGLYRQTLTPFPTDTPAPPATATAIPAVAVTGTVTATIASTVTVTPPPTATPRLQPTSIADADFQLLYNRALESYQAIGFTDADLRGLVESSLYQQRLQQVFADGVAKDAPHVKFDYVRFNNEADAAAALAELTSNQITFPALITRTNEITQPQPMGSGGSIDWTPASVVEQQFGPEIAGPLAVKAIGAPAGVFTSTLDGAYVLLPLGRETRPLSESDLQQQQQQAFSDWLNGARNDATLVTRPATLTDVIPADVRNAARNFLANFGQ
jgi:parvulin-like peptidyl-prolyl isomerase